jgi:hypothetical protein
MSIVPAATPIAFVLTPDLPRAEVYTGVLALPVASRDDFAIT